MAVLGRGINSHLFNMKKLIFCLIMAIPFLGFCQSEQDKTVVFAVDTAATDSFFVLQTTFVPGIGKIDTLKEYKFFRDTQSLKNYRDNLKFQVDALLERIKFLRIEYDSLNSRLLELDTIVAEVINFVGGDLSNHGKFVEHEIPVIANFDFICPFSKNGRRKRKKKRG